MHLGDLVPPPYARAASCDGPCAWCGSDGSAPLVSGAALSRDVTLLANNTLSRVGLWLSLPEGVRALRVYLAGGALRDGLVAPTAVRVHTADVSVAAAPAWRGAPLTGATLDGERVLVAELRALPLDGSGLSRVCVLDVAGVTRDAGEGRLLLRVTCEGGGCLTQSIALRVRTARDVERTVTGAYVAFVDELSEQTPRVARWVDATVGALVASGALRGLVAARSSASIDGVARVNERGVDGPLWRAMLQQMASGRVSWVELWDPCDPEAFGVSIALATRARPSPCEMSAWVARASDGLRDAWWRAACHDRHGTLQALVGRLPDPVTPRALTPWERGRGLRRFNSDAPWLARFVRAPGERAHVRNVMYEGDAVRACWPGPIVIERCSA